VVKARCGGTREEIGQAIEALAGPDMRIILDIARIDEDDGAYAAAAEDIYRFARDKLAAACGP
jgi:hypothetical protein